MINLSPNLAHIKGKIKPNIWQIKEDIVLDLNVKNLNYASFLVGMPGSGKSLRALSFIESCSYDGYNPEYVIFTPSEFIKLVKQDKTNLKKGSCILWDEAGTLSNKNWYSETNKAVSYVFQSFRYRNLGLFMTVPSTSFIDKSILPAFKSRIHCIKWDEQKEQANIRFYESEHNPIYNKTYNKHIREYRNQDYYILNEYLLNSPKNSIIRNYEKLKDEYLIEHYDDLDEVIDKEIENKNTDFRKPKNTNDIVDIALDEITNNKNNNWIKKDDIDTGYIGYRCPELGSATIYRIKNAIKFKLKELNHPLEKV
jgi:hypothetical protein